MNNFLTHTQKLMKTQRRFHQVIGDFKTNFMPSFELTIIDEW